MSPQSALTERYSIRNLIGRGGVGEVYEGWQNTLERPVAIKLLRLELTANAAAIARFEREARTTCLLRHPNVVTVIDVGTADEDGRHFVVMELLEGETLAELLERQGRLPVDQALDIAWQVIHGMTAGEEVGLVHRDLKPENIFVLNSEHVKVLDFGLATLLGPTAEELGRLDSSPPDQDAFDEDDEISDPRPARLTRPGALMGTPRYMAPEQVLGWSADHRSDLYSFGVILFEMLSGRSPFLGPRPRDYMVQHRQVPPPRLDGLAPDLPTELCDLVARLLSKAPSERFADWASLAASLRELGTPRRPGAVTPPPSQQHLPDQPYRFLRPFSAASRSIFFGRERDMAAFSDLWLSQDPSAMLVLTGASGVGKTSFLSARVMPWLEEGGHRLLQVRGTRRPLVQLVHQAARELGTPGVARDEDALPGLLDSLLQQDDRPIVLVLDQLEEVLTTGRSEDSHRLQAGLAGVLAASDGRVRAILSLREDYLGSMLRTLHPLPVDLQARTLPLRPLDKDDLLAALVGPGNPQAPVRYPRFSFEEGLAPRIVEDLLSDSAGEVAPRVQLVGARLWEMVDGDQDPIVITAQHYEERLGGARGILARMMDEAVNSLDTVDQGVAKELLRALTHLPGSPTSRPAAESELVHTHGDGARRLVVLRQLETRWRLVHGYADERYPGERLYRIAHEALIRRIQDYGEEMSERNRARQVLSQGLSLWLRGGCREDDLLPDEHFVVVERHIGDLVLRTTDERRFFGSSQEKYNRGWMRRKEAERRQRLRRQLQLTLIPAALILVGVLLGQALAGFQTLRVWQVQAMSALDVPRLPLTGAALRGADLQGVRLPGATFDDADLTQTNFSGADLLRASMQGTQLSGATFRNANLQGATLDVEQLFDTSFRGADLRKATLRGDLSGADFAGARFDLGTQWPGGTPPHGALGPFGEASGARLKRLELVDLDLLQMDLSGADFSGSRFHGVSLHLANLEDAVLPATEWEGVDLGQAVLTGANLRGAHLRNVEAPRAVFSGADLKNAVLAGVDLRSAQLDGAHLCGTDLSQALLDGASFAGAVACATTQWPTTPPPGVVMSEAVQPDTATP